MVSNSARCWIILSTEAYVVVVIHEVEFFVCVIPRVRRKCAQMTRGCPTSPWGRPLITGDPPRPRDYCSSWPLDS